MTPTSAAPGQALTTDGMTAERAVTGAHIPTLLTVLIQLTGDRRWLSDRYAPRRPRGGIDPDDGGLPEDAQEEIRAAALTALHRWSEGEIEPTTPSRAELHELMCFAMGEQVDERGVPMVAEEIGLYDRDAVWKERPLPESTEKLRVAIVGAGFNGLCMAIKLAEARIPFVILERSPAVGGTWWDNVYPGCGVDSPTHLYQYSFETYADWPEYYSKREEIQAYLERCIDKYRIREHIRYSTEVLEARWDEDALAWRIEVENAAGTRDSLTTEVLISGTGLLNQAKIPTIEGADTFDGPAMHTARWRSDVDYAGKRVAVIGTGASAMQLVPSIAGVAAQVTVFQRSAQWAGDNPDYKRAVSPETRWLLRHVPFYLGWYRYRQFWIFNDNVYPKLQIDPGWPHPERSINRANDHHRASMTRYIEDKLEGRPDLLAKCVPSYPPYGKRMLMDNNWYETIRRDDVDLVTEKIAEITPTGVVTADGVEHPADIIAYATGFDSHRMLAPINVVGRNGETIRGRWGDDDARAYLGITVPDFPNFFCLFGPNTGLGHGGSGIFQGELQVRYIMSALHKMHHRGIAAIDVHPAVHDDYNERVDRAHDQMIWSHPGMTTWYRNDKGRVVSLSPWRLVDYWEMTRDPHLTEYRLTYCGPGPIRVPDPDRVPTSEIG